MNKALTRIGHRSSQLFLQLDALLTLVRTREYQGTNPALASVYAPYRLSVIVMLAITLLTLGLGAILLVDSAAVAKAHVVILSNRKTVQHLEGGIINKLLVKDGDVVKQGQPLLLLSDVSPKANRAILESQLHSEQVTEARLVALRDNKPMAVSDEIRHAAAADGDLSNMIVEQTELFDNQRKTYQDKEKTLRLRIEQTTQEIAGLESQVKSATGQLSFIDDEIKTVKVLVKKGLAVKPRLLQLQREKERLEGDRGQFMASISKARQSINEIEVQLLNLRNDFNTQNGDALKDSHSKLSDLNEKLRAASDVVTRTTITAPSEGIVTGLKFHTEGGVIPPGSPIMDIVPQTDELLLEARINPLDIDVVTPGLKARVVFSAYRSRSLPQLYGSVSQVSADSFTEAQGPQEASYYTARVVVDRTELTQLAPQIKLYPGMPAEIYIHTGTRSFLGYLFAPITDSLRKAFKES